MGFKPTEGVLPMIGASVAVSIPIEGLTFVTVGDDDSGSPDGTDGEGAGGGATVSSAMDSSEESDIRSTVEGILDDLDGRDILDRNRARKDGNNLLALEAMRSI